MIKNLVIVYLVLHVVLGIPNVKYGLQVTWGSAALITLTAPFYSATWMVSARTAERVFTPLYTYEDPHRVSTGSELVYRQPDWSWAPMTIEKTP